MASASRLVPVLDVGGTHVLGAVVDVDAQRVVAGSLARRDLRGDDSAEAIVADLVQCADALCAPAQARWGVAMPGPFEYDTGVARFAGVGKFDALNGYDVGAALRARIAPAPAHVHFVNDAAAFLIGEWTCGAAAGRRRAVGVTLGTGVGSAFLADGEIVTSGDGLPPGGEIFRTCYHGQPIEQTVSRRALLQCYARATPTAEPELDVRELAELARHGDPVAARVFADVFTAFGEALGPCLDGFGAEVLVVGGSIARSWDVVADPIRAGMRRHAAALDAVTVTRAAHLADAPLLGAAFAASVDARA